MEQITVEFVRRQIAGERETLIQETARLHELTGHLHADAQRGADISGDVVNLHRRLAEITSRAARLQGTTDIASYTIPKES